MWKADGHTEMDARYSPLKGCQGMSIQQLTWDMLLTTTRKCFTDSNSLLDNIGHAPGFLSGAPAFSEILPDREGLVLALWNLSNLVSLLVLLIVLLKSMEFGRPLTM
jgi:hypothetical protein